MSAEIFLVRHGRTRRNDIKHIIHGRSSNEPLLPIGLRQAEAHGRSLARVRDQIVAVLASTAVRAQSTMRISTAAAGITHLRPLFDTRLEEVDQGEWTDQVREVTRTEAVRAERDRLGFDFAAPGGESVNHKVTDMMAVFEQHVPAEGITVVYTHGLAIRGLIARFSGMTAEQMSGFELANASTSRLSWSGDESTVSQVNDVSYLDHELITV